MLRSRSHWLAAALIATSVLTTAVASAQQPTPAPHGDRMLSRMQRKLGLTDDQVTKIRAIYAQHRDAHRTVGQSLRQTNIELRQLALSGADPNAIAAKKAQVAQLMSQGMDLRIQTLQEIGPVLTAEQRDKLAQMGPDAMGRRHRGPKPPATQS